MLLSSLRRLSKIYKRNFVFFLLFASSSYVVYLVSKTPALPLLSPKSFSGGDGSIGMGSASSSSSSATGKPVCGLSTGCASGLLGFRIYTGRAGGGKTKQPPTLCVDDVEIFRLAPNSGKKGLKPNYGRGLNVVVYQPPTAAKRHLAHASTVRPSTTTITTTTASSSFITTSVANSSSKPPIVVSSSPSPLSLPRVHVFDTFVESSSLLRFLKYNTRLDSVLFVVSFDEASQALDADAKKWLKVYGASKIEKLKFRGAYILVGQRGLPFSKAVEAYRNPRGSSERFAKPLLLHGCLKIPMGNLSKVKIPKPQVTSAAKMDRGKFFPRCGVQTDCPSDQFSLYVYTGRDMHDEAKICYQDRFVMSKGLNGAGRGLNLVVVNNSTRRISRLAHFDTYAEDSSPLEIFLEGVVDGEIVIAATFDDASRKLSDLARQLLNDLGAGNSQNIHHRDNWYFVGQKGIDGFTFYEDLVFSGAGGKFPSKPINRSLCVPFTLPSRPIVPDPLPPIFEKRHRFCSLYLNVDKLPTSTSSASASASSSSSPIDSFVDFCDVTRLDEEVTPAPLVDVRLSQHLLFTTPIFVLAPRGAPRLRFFFETLIRQPGMRPALVTVMTMKETTTVERTQALAEIFGFRTMVLDDGGGMRTSGKLGSNSSSSPSLISRLTFAGINAGFRHYSSSSFAIVLEEDYLLAPDYFLYLAQVFHSFKKDDSLLTISGWNPNGYEMPGILTPDEHTVWRHIDGVPGVAYLLKRRFWEMEVAPHWRRCCETQGDDESSTWQRGWRLNGSSKSKEMLVPDISRVFIVPPPFSPSKNNNHQMSDAAVMDELLGRKRRTNLAAEVKIVNQTRLRSADYEADLLETLKGARFIDGNEASLKRCLKMRWNASSTSFSNINVSKIKSEEDETVKKWLGEDFPIKDFAKSKFKTFVIFVEQKRDEKEDAKKRKQQSARNRDGNRAEANRESANLLQLGNYSTENASTNDISNDVNDLTNDVVSNRVDIVANIDGVQNYSLTDGSQATDSIASFDIAAIEDHRVFRRLCRCFRLFAVDVFPVRGLHDGAVLGFGYKWKRVFLIGTASRYRILRPKGIEPVRLG